MSLQINFPFITPANYEFDSDKIELVNGKVKLKLEDNVGLIFEQNFTNDAGFIYDNTKAEFVGGKVQQINQIPVNATFGANYNSDINGSWGDGFLAGTAFGGAAVSDGKLDLAHDDIRYVDYSAVGNAGHLQIGTIKFKIIPNYSGNPTTWQSFFSEFKTQVDYAHYFYMASDTGGDLWIYFNTAIGVFNANFGQWNPTAGQEYEFELNYDITNGVQQLFINGIQFGATKNIICTRNSDILKLRIGSLWNYACSSNFKIDDFAIFNTVQHTANYAPGYIVSDNKYLESKVELPQFLYSGLGAIQGFTDLMIMEVGIPKEIWNEKYWDGVIWTASNGTYLQANTKAEILANILSFPASDILDIDVIFPENNSVQNNIDNLNATYTGQIYPVSNPVIKPASSLQVQALDNFVEVVGKIGSDDIKYTLLINGIEKYWDGVNWIGGTGYLIANTAAEIAVNCGSIDFGLGLPLKFIAYLHSENGETLPELDNLQIEYDFFGGQPSDTNKCIVYGFIYGSDSLPIENVVIRVKLKDVADYNNEIQIGQTTHLTKTNGMGYWELELTETDSLENNIKYNFEFIHQFYNLNIDKNIPDVATKNFAELI